jgi:hypothetical protein
MQIGCLAGSAGVGVGVRNPAQVVLEQGSAVLCTRRVRKAAHPTHPQDVSGFVHGMDAQHRTPRRNHNLCGVAHRNHDLCGVAHATGICPIFCVGSGVTDYRPTRVKPLVAPGVDRS